MPTLQQPPATEDDIEGLVVLLLREGSKADAIALIQEETGAAPQEARQHVTELSRRHGISRLRLWPLTLAVALGLIGVILFAATRG